MHNSKPAIYETLAQDAAALTAGETDFLANAANVSSLIYHSLPGLNWAGFYIYKGGELVLGPFQGKSACARIPLGKGVCGASAKARKAIVVKNVHEFPGHIACDSASRSEIVVPLIKDGRLLGVLDVDSPELGRFDAQDQAGLEKLVRVFLERSAPPDSAA